MSIRASPRPSKPDPPPYRYQRATDRWQNVEGPLYRECPHRRAEEAQGMATLLCETAQLQSIRHQLDPVSRVFHRSTAGQELTGGKTWQHTSLGFVPTEGQ